MANVVSSLNGSPDLLAEWRSRGNSGSFSDMFDQVFANRFLKGSYTVDTLPLASLNQGKYAYCLDLGGGQDMVLSDGTSWKHIRRGLPGTYAPTSLLNITPLKSPQTIIISGSLTIQMNLNILMTNLYPGYELTIKRPGVLGLGGSLGINLGGGSTLYNMLGSSWYDYVYDGSTLQQVRGSSLLS